MFDCIRFNIKVSSSRVCHRCCPLDGLFARFIDMAELVWKDLVTCSIRSMLQGSDERLRLWSLLDLMASVAISNIIWLQKLSTAFHYAVKHYSRHLKRRKLAVGFNFNRKTLLISKLTSTTQAPSLPNRLQARTYFKQTVSFRWLWRLAFLWKRKTCANNKLTLLVAGNMKTYDLRDSCFMTWRSHSFPLRAINFLMHFACLAASFAFAKKKVHFRVFFPFAWKSKGTCIICADVVLWGDAMKNPQPEKWIVKNVSCFSFIFSLSST